MLEIGIGFLVLSVIASIFGYDQTAGIAAGMAQVILIVLAALALFAYLLPKININEEGKDTDLRNHS